MKSFTAVLLHTVVMCLLLPGTALNACSGRDSSGGHEKERGRHPATVLPRRSRHHQPVRRAPRCQNTIGMMPPDDENEARRVRRAKCFISTISLAYQAKVFLALTRLAPPRASDTPLYQSQCSLLI
jgi:hypothetical protein